MSPSRASGRVGVRARIEAPRAPRALVGWVGREDEGALDRGPQFLEIGVVQRELLAAPVDCAQGWSDRESRSGAAASR